jgi:HK97 family phage major capsid protein
MPRVVPKTKKQESQARLAELRALRDLVRAEAQPEIYTPNGPESFFRDLVMVQEDEIRKHQQISLGVQPEQLVSASVLGDVSEARQRLERHSERALHEARALSTSGEGADFIPSGLPAYLADLFNIAARERGVLPQVLPTRPLAEKGMDSKAPRLTSGGTIAVQTSEGSGVSSTDPAEVMASSPVSTVAGQVDLSQQLLDRSEPNMDEVIASDLGRAHAEKLDETLLTGSGTAPNMRGILNVSGITAVTYTDGSPTNAKLNGKLMDAYSQFAGAYGAPPDLVLVAPRRLAYIYNTKDVATGVSIPPQLPPPARFVAVPNIPLNRGAGTNEDTVILLRSEECPILLGPIQVRVTVDVLSGTLQARAQAFRYANAVFSREPKAIATLAGTGLVPPVFA